MGNFRLSKLDAARRQLELAIPLYFADSDPVPIHTLVAAACGILHDINTKVGGKPMLIKDTMLEICKRVEPDLAKRIRNSVNAPQNFLKHADKDPDGILQFDPQMTKFLLFDACITYQQLTGESPDSIRIYDLWIKMQYHEGYKQLPVQYALLAGFHARYKDLPKQQFFLKMMKVFAQAKLFSQKSTQ